MLPAIAAIAVTSITFLYMCFRQLVPDVYVKSVARPIQKWGQQYLARQQARSKSPLANSKKKPSANLDKDDEGTLSIETLPKGSCEDTKKQEDTPDDDIVLFKPAELLVYLCVIFAGTWFCFWRLYTASVPGYFWASLSIAYTTIALSAGTDLKNHLVPNEIVLGALTLQTPVLLLQSIFVPEFFPSKLIGYVACLLVIFLLLLLISRVAGGGLGLGDVKLLAVIGFCLGFFMTISVVFYAIFLSFFAAIFLLITRKKNRKQAIPFAPFIYLGFLLMIGFGL